MKKRVKILPILVAFATSTGGVSYDIGNGNTFSGYTVSSVNSSDNVLDSDENFFYGFPIILDFILLLMIVWIVF